MGTLVLNEPEYIYKKGKPIKVIIDIETYTNLLSILEKKKKKTGKTFTTINGVTIVRNGSPKTGKDAAKFAGMWKNKGITDSVEYARQLRKKAHTRQHMKEALKELNK